MHGRRLATTDRLIVLASPDSDAGLSRIREWADDHDIDVEVVDIGDDIGDVSQPDIPTLGITLGGDGTFLEGIKQFTPNGIPQLGVNAGTLSFLARVEQDDIEDALDEVIRGRATVDSRQKLKVESSGLDTTGINEVTVEHVPPENPFDRKVTRLEVFADDEYVGQYEGNGVAVSTPTGSTGLSLSAGGPIHMPGDNHSLQIVPLHTHRIGTRPLVMAANTDIKIITRGQASLLVDGGRAHKILSEESVVRITGADESAHVVRTSYDDQFMTAITEKLGWGLRGADNGPQDLLETDIPPREPTFLEHARDIAIEAAKSVGEPLRELHGRVEDITYKSDKSDIVTEADHQANRIITTVIENEFPDHSIFSEESEFVKGESAYKWVIDPVDGTGNFAHGNPQYSVSIALLEAGQPVLGVVYVPETDEVFHAIEGGDAYKGETQIVTTERELLEESMLLSGYDPDGGFLTHFYNQTQGVRSLGSAALNLCYLANGSADAVWEYDTYPWDVAAGVVIARAAGATVSNRFNEEYTVEFDSDERKSLLGSNGFVHPSLYDHLESSNLV
ncbi:inositol monophosphatase family protein [Halovenus rubra]|uniref:Inositol monophosphatase family protein n=2 Tax=Halovenus rubra TaxID=869890 RepID=A0ACC7E175_9EURY|nr:inositol monophosphatase family protein [Halovenus rubra]